MRLIRGNPCPGAGGLAGRGPFGGLDTKELAEVVVFRLNGFSLQVRLPGVPGVCEVGVILRPAERLGGLALRLVCGVAGAELVLVGGGGGGDRFGEQRG